MKIQCECGHLIHDGTDGLGHKAHFIPDRRWNEMWDALDDAIEREGNARKREASAMQMRMLIGDMARSAWQCTQCGMLYLENAEHKLRAFKPLGDEDVSGILSGGPKKQM